MSRVHCMRSTAWWLPLVVIGLMFAPASSSDSKDDAAAKAPVARWLVLGPLAVPYPAFHEEGREKTGAADLLDYEHLSTADLWPAAGASVPVPGGAAEWTPASSDSEGVLLTAPGDDPAIAYLAAYVEAPRWMKADIEVRSTHPMELFVDGASLAEQKKASREAPDKPTASATAALKEGKHLLLVKTVFAPGDSLPHWRVDVRVAPAKGFEAALPTTVDPARSLTIGDVLETAGPSDIQVSPDGEYVLVAISERFAPEGKRDQWIEIRRIEDAGLVWTLRDLADVSDWKWAPTGHRISYVATDDEAGTLRVLDVDTGEASVVVENVKGLSDYAWHPKGSSVVYAVREKAKKDETGVQRVRDLEDRREGARDETHIYMSTVPEGMTRRLTAGPFGAHIYSVRPDGRAVLIGRSIADLEVRPYSTTELVLLDLEDGSIETLWKGHFLGDAVWSPDGKTLLVTAGPSSFGEGGLDVPAGVTPNDYDTQAYLFDPAAKSATPITRDFDPAIVRAYWPKGGDIYFAAEDGEYVRLYRYGVRSKSFEAIPLEGEVVHAGDFAENAAVAVVAASSADRPPRVFAVNAKRGRARVFLEPAKERFRHIEIGRVEPFDFTSEGGRKIAGRVHYPPHFDPEKKWPCIVYYYGGTSPVDRSFGGRYPKNLWAAHGYVVYVLQPSGATGFGQEFSAAHVNDWGDLVSKEIIEGAGKFLDAHPFVDPHRVGCIGASFGGFMTQLLVTKTDIFAAAVSHAGISAISSYWGEGYWGYGYNAVSAANSFPWNRPDIYVDRSPLYAADKIATPLLLLHGTADTNVPPGESEQMYTALKLLGREVEYLRIGGQNHFVLDYKKRIIWSDAILAWFDKWLKDEPEWWNSNYPPLDEGTKKRPEALGLHEAEMEKYGTTLFGVITRDDVTGRLAEWEEARAAYEPDAQVVAGLRDDLRGVRITCVFGTWCSDSRREVPRLWKVLDQAGFPSSRLEMYAVASSRFNAETPVEPEVLEWSKAVKAWYDVEAVATIIVSRGGKELGRIVESPEASIERDLAGMFGR